MSLLDELAAQARAQGLAKRSAMFAVLVPIFLLIFALFLGDDDFSAYVAPLIVATACGVGVHLMFRWLERRGR